MQDTPPRWDVIIVGAGPAGLTAAAYLGRFRRTALVLHDDRSRARWIPTSHNTPGFPEGVGGTELLARSTAQAKRYGASLRAETVTHIKPQPTGFEVTTRIEPPPTGFEATTHLEPPLTGLEATADIEPPPTGVKATTHLEPRPTEFGVTTHIEPPPTEFEATTHIEPPPTGVPPAVGRHLGRYVLLASGVADKFPPLPGIEAAVQRGTIRICPICDAYEVIDASIAVEANGEHGIREAEFLTGYSSRVSLIYVGMGLGPEQRERVAASGLTLLEAHLQDLKFDADGARLQLGHDTCVFDACYLALGCAPRTSLLGSLDAEVDGSGVLVVDAHQETSIKGIYAAGDVVRGLNQIVVAAAEGAIAATAIHNRLRTGASSR